MLKWAGGIFAIMVLMAALVQAQTPPVNPVAVPCSNNDSACNLGIFWYYSPLPSPVPTPLASASAAYQIATAGKFTEIVDPNTGNSIAHFIIASGIGSTAWNPQLCEYDLNLNVLQGCATIDATKDTSTSGQSHDFGSLIVGPNGEMMLPWGAISQVSAAGQFGNAAGTGTGTTYPATPFKFVNPTASPSAVAAAPISYWPNAAASSELNSMCWHLSPGPNTYSNEIERCYAFGQAQKCKCFATNGGQMAMGNNQVGSLFHWTSTLDGVYVDAAGAPSVAGSLCSAISYTNCDDLLNNSIGQMTNSQTQLTSTPGDSDWFGIQLTGVTDGVAGNYAFVTLPNNGEDNAATQCTISGTTGASETTLQLAQDISNTFNGSGGTVGTGFSGSAGCTAQQANYFTYVSTASVGKSNTCGSTTGATGPCIVVAHVGCVPYASHCDTVSPPYQLNLPGAGTCTTFCTVSATRSGGQSHPTLFGCTILWTWGQEGVCTFDVDNMTQGFNAASYGSTGFGDALMLGCMSKNDYSISTHQLTVHTCNLNGTTTNVAVGPTVNVTSNNPATYFSPGISSGQGSSTNCANVSPWLMPVPAVYPSGMIHMNCDWSAKQDPNVTGSGFFVAQSVSTTNLPNGNLITFIEQQTAGGAPQLFACVSDITTWTSDGCFQVTTDALTANTNTFQVNAATGADGSIVLLINSGNASIHGCGNVACIMEYSAPPTFGNSPVFSFVRSWAFSGNPSASGSGICPQDQEGGHHMLCLQLWGTFSSAANTTSASLLDIRLP